MGGPRKSSRDLPGASKCGSDACLPRSGTLRILMKRDTRSDQEAADVEALEDTLVRVSNLAMHMEGHLTELDINPLMVLPAGQGVKAADALIVLRGT